MTADQLARRYRDKANRLTKKIEDLRRQRANHTPKMARQEMSRNIEAAHLERVRTAFNRMAEAIEGPGVPEEFGFYGFKEIEAVYRTRLGHGNYYQVWDTGEYHDDTATARAFREWIESDRPLADRNADADRKEKDLIARLESEVRFANIPGFFPTPPELVERMLDEAEIEKGMNCLEPSAGKGDICDALKTAGVRVIAHEIDSRLANILQAKCIPHDRGDFMDADPEASSKFDRVVMNPPFERGQDIDHVIHAFKFLRPGGRLVALMSAGVAFRTDTKTCMFRDWLSDVGGKVTILDEGQFSEAFRRTGVRVVMVTIDKEEPQTEAEDVPCHLRCPVCGAVNQIVNDCGCDPGNMPTKAPPGYLF